MKLRLSLSTVQTSQFEEITCFSQFRQKCRIMLKQLPIHWLILLNIVVLNLALIAGGIATWLQLHHASLNNASNLLQSQTTAQRVHHSFQQLLPLHLAIKELNHTLQTFKYEFTLLYLDSHWNNTLLKPVTQSITLQKNRIIQRWPTGEWPTELAEIRENLGIILDIARDALNSNQPGELPQLYRDTEPPLLTISNTFQRLETELSKNIHADYEQAQQSSRITHDNIQQMSTIFDHINRNTMSIFAVLVVFMLATKLLFMRELHHRLLVLANYAAQVAKEQFTNTPPFLINDSTGKLAQALHLMALEIHTSKKIVQALTADLETKVTARTAELQMANEKIMALNDQLQQDNLWIEAELQLTRRLQQAETARQAAEVANQAKSVFLANMSHELRTPLNGILGYAQILNRDQSLTAKQREGIGIIQRSGEYLLTLINDVLDLSKVEAGKLELYATAFNFSAFLQGITDLFQMRAQQKGISFRYEPLTSLPKSICADEKRLRQVLINLLGNAVKFTDHGEVVLKIGSQEDQIRFQVEDLGCGIASADLDKIFQPFQQVGEQKRRMEGTGLGLPITKKLVEMMGGELQVESTLGKGSTFWMALTLPAAPEVPTESEKLPLVKGFQEVPRTLLVIDDKWENRSVLTQLLTPLGFTVEEASSGPEGITKASQLNPDLILTDLVMPDLDGFETTRQLRAIPALAKVPIIAVSASVFESFQQRSRAAGCNAFLPNPIQLEPLLELLRTWLGLTWIYESGPAGVAISSAEGELVGPSPQKAAILLDLVMMGDIGGILEEIEQLEQTDEKLLPFVKRVRQLAKGFEEQKIGELVKQYVK